MKTFKLITIVAILTAIFAFSALAQSNETVIITGDTSAGENQPGWLFNRDQSTSTPYYFDTAQASIGKGSVYVEPITNTDDNGGVENKDKFIAEYFYLSPLSEFNSISYDFLIAGNGTAADANDFYLNVYVLRSDINDTFYACRYDYVPTTGSITAFTTYTVDTATIPVNVTSRSGASCPTTLAQLLVEDPDAFIRVFAINVGDTSGSDTGLAGYVDNVVLDTDDGTTTFDLEPSKEACKRGGWRTFTSPTFRNQGECISYIQSNRNSN